MIRILLILTLTLGACYIIKYGVPETPADINFAEFFEFMKGQIKEILELSEVVSESGVKLAIVGGTALLAVGVVKEIVK